MPTHTFRPKAQSITPEIRLLRRLIRQTHAAIRQGTIDPLDGTRTIARLAEALSSLHRVQHAISPPDPRHDRLVAALDSLLRAWPDDLKLPKIDLS